MRSAATDLRDPARGSSREGRAGLEERRQFVTLDALRGIAAIGVLYFHSSWLFGSTLFGHGYLAVDFFFMLSGFVMTYAYQRRLDEGWSARSFLTVRMIRLYPLYLLGLLLGLVFQLLQDRFGTPGAALPARTTLGLLTLGLFFIPAPPQFAGVSPRMFPFNRASWSLFYEIIGNFAHAVFIRRRGVGALVVAIAIACVGLSVSAVQHGNMDFGASRSELIPGFFRLWFAYLVGIVMCRVWQQGRFRPSLAAHYCGLILLAVLAPPAFRYGRVFYDLFVTVVIFPILLLTSASSEPHTRLVTPFRVLGLASYAVYILQVPLENIFVRGLVKLRGGDVASFAPWPGFVFVVGVVVIAFAVDRVYDTPLRGYLRRKVSVR